MSIWTNRPSVYRNLHVVRMAQDNFRNKNIEIYINKYIFFFGFLCRTDAVWNKDFYSNKIGIYRAPRISVTSLYL